MATKNPTGKAILQASLQLFRQDPQMIWLPVMATVTALFAFAIVTGPLVLEGAPVHQEVQLLRFHRPEARTDEGAGTLTRLGFNHVCFRVADLDATLAHLSAHGVKPRNEIMDFHDRRLVFLDGPGVVVELAEWVSGSAGHSAHLGNP